MSFSAEEIDKNLPKNGKNSKKPNFLAFSQANFWKKSQLKKMPQAAPTEPYYSRKLHHNLCLKSLSWHGSACGILKKITHQYARTVSSKITLASSQPWYLTKFGTSSWTIKNPYVPTYVFLISNHFKHQKMPFLATSWPKNIIFWHFWWFFSFSQILAFCP